MTDTTEAMRIADAVLKAAGSGFQHYMSASKERIIAATQAALANQTTQQWQPIETAPKDGRSILAFGMPTAYAIDSTNQIVVAWDEHSQCWSNGVALTEGIIDVDDFTHWMPLPASPQVEGSHD